MDKLIDLIKTQYGIDCSHAEEREGGWSALAYKISNGANDYFLKIYDKNRASTSKLTALIDVYIPIIIRLNESTPLSGRLPVPLLTKTNLHKFENAEGVYLLYRYIDGETVGDKLLSDNQVHQLSSIIAALHSYKLSGFPQNTVDIIEDFSLPFLNQLQSTLSPDTFIIPNELSHLLTMGKEALLQLMERTDALSVSLKQNTPPMVLCHTDIHGWNLMVAKDAMFLIDWEGLKIAPPEADIMFIVDKPYYEQFLHTYRRVHQGYTVNADALEFYKARRKLEDIWEFIQQLLYDSQDTESRAKTISYLEREIRML